MKKIAIFGVGISGKSVLNYLINDNKQVIIIDDNIESFDKLKELYQKINLLKNIEFCYDKSQIDWRNIEFLVMSPGIPLKYPKPHEIVILAQKNHCKIISDIELFYLLHKDKNFIGITGTNGKSTTTALTGHIFKENKIDSQIGGNLGIPCFDLELSDNYIFEMSSYQLDLGHKTHFKIATILNITPDHLDRHKDLEGYIEAKKRIFLNQTKDDFALINIDDQNCYKIYQDLEKNPEFKGKLIAISNKISQENSISLINNELINNIGGTKIQLDAFQNLKGNHNKQNITFAYAISYLSGISDTKIINSIKTFQGLRHRLQFVRKIGNVSFINDSKATNVDSAICALEAYDKIFWIAGGKGKNDDLSLLTKYLGKIKKAFLIGQDQEKFANFLNENKVENYLCDNLDRAFKKAYELAKKEKGEINIILSPACASFDQWQNFEKRGDYFCQLVNELDL